MKRILTYEAHRAIVTKNEYLSMVQSLAELKAENAKSEDDVVIPPQEIADEIDDDEVEDELENVGEVAEPGTTDDNEPDTDAEDEPQTPEVEGWMQSEESQDSQDVDKKFTDGDVAAAKRKLRAKLDDKNDEVEKLKAQVQELENGRAPNQQSVKPQPKREDFENTTDPDEAYIDAITDWKIEKNSADRAAEQAANQTRQANDSKKQEVNQSVDQHYERAVRLAEKSNISSDAYKATDLTVRQAINNAIPGNGDLVADLLISSIGEGSEKVFYNLGVNSSRLNVLTGHLQSDPSGLKAVAYLSRLGVELDSHHKRKTNAPKPASKVKGNGAITASSSKLQKKYDKFHSEGNGQAALTLKRKAKKGGTDTSNW